MPGMPNRHAMTIRIRRHHGLIAWHEVYTFSCHDAARREGRESRDEPRVTLPGVIAIAYG